MTPQRTYNIVRRYRRGGKRLLAARVTEAYAQTHCSDPESSSSTCTTATGKRRTRQLGPWFDSYECR